MPDFRVERVVGLVGVAAVLAFASPASAQVGVVTVTDGGTSAGPGTALQVGQPITTGPDGHVHLMFVDGSAVTAGPNSTLTIRQFSYDTASKTGALALDLAQGTMRFVGGAISKTSEVQITTPSSQVGIRGGITAVAVTPDGGTSASFLAGIGMRVTGQGQTQAAMRPGSLIGVASGGIPSAPTVMTTGQFAGFQSLDRTPSRTAAATAQSADQSLARSGLSQTTSGVGTPRAEVANAHTSTLLQGRVQQLQANVAGQQILSQPIVSSLVTPPRPVIQQPIVSVPLGQPPQTTVASISASPVTTPGSTGGLQKAGAGTLMISGGATTLMLGSGTSSGSVVGGLVLRNSTLTLNGTGH